MDVRLQVLSQPFLNTCKLFSSRTSPFYACLKRLRQRVSNHMSWMSNSLIDRGKMHETDEELLGNPVNVDLKEAYIRMIGAYPLPNYSSSPMPQPFILFITDGYQRCGWKTCNTVIISSLHILRSQGLMIPFLLSQSPALSRVFTFH